MDASTWARQGRVTAIASVPAPIVLLVVDPSDFSRACTVAGLACDSELAVDSCASIAQCDHDAAADLILFQSIDFASDGSSLRAQLAQAAQRWPRAASLVVATNLAEHEMLATIHAGAQGLLTSSASVECLRGAILLLVNGMAVYPLALADHLRQTPPQATSPAARVMAPVDAGRLGTLTARQQDVLQLLARGFSNKAIAKRLVISESTVKVHIRAIMAQHGATNRTEIVAHFLKGSTLDQ